MFWPLETRQSRLQQVAPLLASAVVMQKNLFTFQRAVFPSNRLAVCGRSAKQVALRMRPNPTPEDLATARKPDEQIRRERRKTTCRPVGSLPSWFIFTFIFILICVLIAPSSHTSKRQRRAFIAGNGRPLESATCFCKIQIPFLPGNGRRRKKFSALSFSNCATPQRH